MAINPDLAQLLTDENPHGPMDPTADVRVGTVRLNAHLLTLRERDNEGPTRPAKDLQDGLEVDGPAGRFNKDKTAPPADDYDKLMKGLFWYFKGEQVRISKALRIQYRVGKNTYNLLIGYEGSGDGM